MVRAPLHFHGRIPVPEVAPLTYRDGVSQLELVYELSQYLKNILHPSLQSTVDQVVADTERLLDEANTQYVDGVQEFQRIHDRFMSDVNASLIALNDGAVSDLVEDATSLLGKILRRTFEPEGEVHRNTYDRMGVVVPHELTFEALQAAADEAYEHGKRLWAAGEITTNQTLRIDGNIDLGGLTIHYTGDTVAVEYGQPGKVSHRYTGTFPEIIAENRVESWANGVVGLRLYNSDSGVFTIPYVANFAINLDIIGDRAGNAYNTYTIGQLHNGKTNLRLIGINRGWSNQNLYLGGRYSHLIALGTDNDGVYHIELANSEYTVNNNTFINASVEGEVTEYRLRVDGQHNLFMNTRFEREPRRVYFAPESRWNHIFHGYHAATLQVVNDGEATNTVSTTAQMNLTGGTVDGNLKIHNVSSVDYPSDVVFAPGANRENNNSYSVRRSAAYTRMKHRDDAHSRFTIEHRRGRFYVGTGDAEPTLGLGIIGTDILGIFGVNVSSTPRNTSEPTGWMQIYVDGAVSYVPYYR